MFSTMRNRKVAATSMRINIINFGSRRPLDVDGVPEEILMASGNSFRQKTLDKFPYYAILHK